MKILKIKTQFLLVNNCFCNYGMQKLLSTVRSFALQGSLRTSKVVGGAPLTQMAFQPKASGKRLVRTQRCHLSQVTFDPKAFKTLV